jgi:O-acetyl-ADP-ribose deacetylase (regulator of RNase III)
MISYITGSIFDSTAHCLVNPVNCVGVMGKGLALEFKHRYPEAYHFYVNACKEHELAVGRIAFYAMKKRPDHCICLFPTKQHWLDLSTMTILDKSFQEFLKYAPQMNVKTVAFPKVGCGLGGLNFEHQVRPLFEKYFMDGKYEVEVYV